MLANVVRAILVVVAAIGASIIAVPVALLAGVVFLVGATGAALLSLMRAVTRQGTPERGAPKQQDSATPPSNPPTPAGTRSRRQ